MGRVYFRDLKIHIMLVEVCANSPESARAAEQAGADRIELCGELAVGGVTPSRGVLEWVREHIRIPVHVLIRPRSGDFCYSRVEFECMLRDIRQCVSMGFAGIVSGCLGEDRQVDADGTARLREAAGSCHFTFHRAFDRCLDPEAALESLESLGVDTILSSGQAPDAVSGLSLLEGLHRLSRHCRLMPGGGIHAGNATLFREAGFSAIHFSGVPKPSGEEPYAGLPMNSPSLLREGRPLYTDPALVSAVIGRLKDSGR